MEMKVVFHVDWDHTDSLLMAIGNMENLLKALSDTQAEIYLVANGSAVKLFRHESASEYASRIERLAEADVHFLMCNNALNKHGIKHEDLLDSCHVVPSGIMEIIRLQAEGCAYVKP